MRNFSATERMMNHTPVIIREVQDKHVMVETMDCRRLPLPRIAFWWKLARGTVTMTRRQYPLRPAYACTINGGQGSTLRRAVLDLRRNPFAHGQLYVALSRVRRREDLKILVQQGQATEHGHALTKNIVWKELLLGDVETTLATAHKRPAGSSHSIRDPVKRRPAAPP